MENGKLKIKNNFTMVGWVGSQLHNFTTENILTHPFKPIIFEDSEILILGTFPSIKSFENEFYYGHPKNQFWNILSIIFDDKKPNTIEEKIKFLKKHKIALWDAICKCKRKNGNSRDDNLEIIEPCNIEKLLKKYPNIKKIAVTSRTAEKIIKKHFPLSIMAGWVGFPLIYLPSPSPLNARLKLNQKAEIWKKLLELM
jgi:hypoxanthine-DNA glycosylase